MIASRTNQKGLTLLSLVIVLAVLGFAAFIFMKLFPVYSEYYAVLQAMKAVQQEPGIAQKSPDEIWRSLERKFYISYVKNVDRNHVKIERKGGQTLRITYEVRDNLIANLDFVAKFDKSLSLVGKDPGGE